MQRELVRRDLIQFDWQVSDQEDFFDRMVAKLLELGYVKDSFGGAIRTREQQYPTALPTQPEAVAIPHSDMEHVARPFIAATRLAAPVDWVEMGSNDKTHPVRFIFMLGFTQKDGHVELLQILLTNLRDPTFMAGLGAAESADRFYELVSGLQGLQD